MAHNPFLVACPDCLAGPGVRCYIRRPSIPNEDGMAVHAARRDSARLRVAVHGSCGLCGRLMVQLTEPDETRHTVADGTGPIPPCPPYPKAGEAANWVPTGAEAFTAYDVQPDPPEDQPMPPPPHDPPALPAATSDPTQDPPGSTVLP